MTGKNKNLETFELNEESYEYKTPKELLDRAKEAEFIPFGQINKSGLLHKGKGGIGQMFERDWFGYAPNNARRPDFENTGVELKVTPFRRLNDPNRIRAKERLVCTMIDYYKEYSRTFEESDFFHKAAQMLVMPYEHKTDVSKDNFFIEMPFLYKLKGEDLSIIKQDWEKIQEYIRTGKAHELSEGLTMYIGACTKGKNAESSMGPQPFSTTLARKRAYAFKSSYMTYLFKRYVFGKEESEQIIKDPSLLSEKTFEAYIESAIAPFYGKETYELCTELGLKHSKQLKNINERIIAKILGVSGKISASSEFVKANIIVKTITLDPNGLAAESMSFPAFEFENLINEKSWENSELHDTLNQRFLIVIFKKLHVEKDSPKTLEKAMFWSMPQKDLEEVEKVWTKTRSLVIEGLEFEPTPQKNGTVVTNNNLPKSSENRVAHVRPHSSKSYCEKNGLIWGSGKRKDASRLPNGDLLTKQSFWLNKRYLDELIKTEKL